jgi:hypothetical protein
MPTTAIASTDITGTSTTLLLPDTIAIPPSTTTGSTSTATNLGSILNAAIAGGYVAHSTGTNYTVTSPIVIHIDSTIQGPLGIDLGGATIISQITNGAPVIEIDVGPGVDLRYLTLSNFTIQGNGQEGDGIKIVADGNDRWVYNWSISNVTVNHVGGYGLDMQGSIFEGLVSNSWMNNDGAGGAYFAHSANGGQVSALRWFGGGFEGNGGDGLTLDNGARDMSVDNATFANNHGVGIAAGSGITSVTGSAFQDNQGAGIWFQCFGNFNDDTFTTSGSQTTGISGYLAGNATLIGNTSTYTGTGTNPTTLANLQGSGSLFATGDNGTLVTGSNIAVSPVGDGDLAHITVSNQGVALPTLAAVTAATTAAVATSTGTGPLETGLKAAMAGGYVAHLTDATYTVTSPIIINVTSTNQGAFGIDLGGAKIISQINNGGPLIEIVVGAGVTLSSLTLSNFSIQGNYGEGDGIKIVADGTDRAISNLSINNVSVEHVGGIGLDVVGNVSRALVVDSWMNGNALGGARFANSPAGGVASGLEWEGGGFRLNGGAGMILANGTHDMVVKGAYFVLNHGPGIDATSGITLVQESGFENNDGSGAIVQGSANFTDDTFSTYGPQTTAVGGYLSGGKVTLTGVSNEYYGSGSDLTVLANVQGSGTLAIAGTGNVLVGSNIAVTGGSPVVGVTTTTVVTTPVVTEGLASDTGVSATDKITANASLIGTADAGAVVHFTVDGNAVATTATANASGAWSYTPTGLSDGPHTIVASETNSAGTGTASVTFTLDTTPPAVTERLVSGGTTTSNPALSGTGEPNATVHFTIDGNAIAGTATADATGAWSYTPTGLANGTHTIVASETDTAGNTGTASLTFTLNTVTTPVVTERLASDTGASSTDRITSNATLSGTADPNAVVHFTVDGSAVAATATADASGAWTYTPTGLADGVHTIVASETNSAGTGTASITFTLDTKAPTVTAGLVNDTGASATDKVTSSAALSGSGDAGAVVHFTVDGTAIAATATANASGVWSYTPTGLADGTHTIVASETDLAGNTGTASLAFALDTTAPRVTEILVNDTGVSATDKLTSNAALTGSGDPGAVVHFTVDGNAIAAPATANSSGVWSYTPTGLADGAHTIVASETDLAGNTGSASLSFTLDTTAPVVTERLVSGDTTTANPALTGTGDANAVVHFTVDGAAITGTATADATGAWSYTPTGLANGTHTVVASETDVAGNTGSASLSFTLQTQPSAPIFTSMVPGNGTVLLTGSTGEAGDTIWIYDSTWIGATTTDANGNWSFTASATSGVVHSFGINEINLAGNIVGGANRAILGSNKAETLTGTTGNDIINGNGGTDTIVGGAGADKLTAGSGKVTFAYNAASDSTPAAADTITDFRHGFDKIDFTNIAGINATGGVPQFQGNITGNGNLTLNAHSVAYLEVGGNTQVLVNTTNVAETVTTTDTHAANMEITLVGVHLGLTSTDFHHT